MDIFWDGVGGTFSATVLQVWHPSVTRPPRPQHMAMFGRVIMVGNLSCYNQVQVSREPPQA